MQCVHAGGSLERIGFGKVLSFKFFSLFSIYFIFCIYLYVLISDLLSFSTDYFNCPGTAICQSVCANDNF